MSYPDERQNNPDHVATSRDDIRPALCQLRRIVHRSGLRDLLTCYGWDRRREAALQFDLGLLPEPLRSAVALFSLGHAVPRDSIADFLPNSLLEVLQRHRILRLHNDLVQTVGLRLVNHYGLMLFCHHPGVMACGYHGPDSLALGAMVLGARGRVLDLCAGVGTQGLLAAISADYVVAVEREPKLSELFDANAVLNGVRERVELRIGDFLNPIGNETFDYVCCNPPLLPVPEAIQFPPVANGGRDGLAFTKTLLASLTTLLNVDGVCHMVGTCLGDKNGPFLSEIEAISGTHGLDIFIAVPCREHLTLGGPMLEALTQTASLYCGIDAHTARSAFLRDLTSMQADHLYSLRVRAQRACSTSSTGRLQMTGHYLRGGDLWSV